MHAKSPHGCYEHASETLVQRHDVRSGTGPGCAIVKSMAESTERQIAEVAWQLERVGTDGILPASGDPSSIRKGGCELAVPVTDVDIARVSVDGGDGGKERVNGSAIGQPLSVSRK